MAVTGTGEDAGSAEGGVGADDSTAGFAISFTEVASGRVALDDSDLMPVLVGVAEPAGVEAERDWCPSDFCAAAGSSVSLADREWDADAERFLDDLPVAGDSRLDDAVVASAAVPTEDELAADEVADESAEGPWLCSDVPDPLSACATPAPPANAAPIPRLMAPAPSHWYGSIRFGLLVR
ncbi:MAG: hypothetical protein HYZ39_17470 [Mycolicibacterium cosmeticum]|nr:hypothetical protein [Mycolicibacterium cosmeticum]